jgi:hypothetical protein
VTTLYAWELVLPTEWAGVVVDQFGPRHEPKAYVYCHAGTLETDDPYVMVDFGNALLEAAKVMRSSK